MQCNARRDLFTSLVGTVPLNDVLADLPLPTPLSTPMEETVLGMRRLSSESKKLLDSTNSTLCSRITEALLAVDTSFLDLKESAQTVPYTPTARDPPLITAVMTSLLPRAVVRVERLDPGLFSSPSRGAAAAAAAALSDKQDAVVPEGPRVEKSASPSVKKKKKRRNDISSSGQPRPKRARRISSSSDESVKQEAPQLQVPPPAPPPAPPTGPTMVTVPCDSLRVSIDRFPIQALSSAVQPPPSKQQKTKKKIPPPLSTVHPPSISDTPVVPVDPLLIKLSRGKLKGYFGLPYSGAVYGIDEGVTQRIPKATRIAGGPERVEDFDYKEFAVVPGATDASEELGHLKKKKKKRPPHQRGDQNKAAHLSKFVGRLESMFDQNAAADDLLDQLTLSELLAHVTSLKQMGILHEVAVESLVQLIGFMDRHVLDSASLTMQETPEGLERDSRGWRETAKDRIVCSSDAALVTLQIVTAPHMPKKVYMEESIDQILALTKFHLENNVYPQFDSVYKAEKKDSGVLPRQKRKTGTTAQGTASKQTFAVYHKLTEVVENMAALTEAQPLTDTTVLMLSSMGTLPFFVENVPVLQLSALRLVRAIFTRYDKHRDLILDEIFASLQKLPSNKRNLRTYKLSNGQHIQMLTALVLQLVQCTVTVPKVPKEERDTSSDKSKEGDKQLEGEKPRAVKKSDAIDAQMTQSYNLAAATASNFLSKFLKKCCAGKDEDDFKPLFENFIQDLLTTLNLPMWPASEVLLTLLGNLLVQTFSTRSMEQSLRLMSLEHLGVIAARLRKDTSAPTSEQENEQLVDIIAHVMELKMDTNSPSPTALLKMDAFSENKQHLQKVLVSYLNKQTEADPACAYARDFYIGQWLYDSHLELEKLLKDRSTSPTANLSFKDFDDDAGDGSSSHTAMQQSEMKKEKILTLLESSKNRSFKALTSILNEHTAALVCRHLASSRALTKSFDLYLNKLMAVSNEPAVHVRTRALKALSSIIAADPTILSRHDMQRAVEVRFRDMSTLVREAAVDLIGRFVLCKPELTLQYYDMICERIRDSGVSVRKRVIKILKDICVLQPDFPKINDICVRILRRISDEEAIRQLVTSVFRELWFAPVDSHSRKETLLRRVTNITAVVGICKDYEWLEQLLEQILKNEDQGSTQAVLQVCQMMVDTLVENVLTLDAKSSGSTGSLMSCIITLYLFCNVRPSLLLNHATTLHPYLGSSCAVNKDVMVLHFVAKILMEVVPLMEHPAQSFLAALEEDLVKLIMKHGQLLIHSSVECLGAVVNSVTKNYTLVKDCFLRFFKCLEQMKILQSQSPGNPQLKTHRHSLLRSLFTVGVLCKFFNFDSIIPCQSEESSISSHVYELLMYFFMNGDEEIQIKTVKGLGLFCIRYPEMMLQTEMRELITEWLTKDCASTKKIEVLRNLHNYLKEVEQQLKVADTKWEKEGTDKQILLEFGDQQSSVSSNIAQAFLHQILEAFLHTEIQVRFGALQAVVLILRQGLVHPAQCVPYLMAMSTDPDTKIKSKADQHLTDHTSRYGHLMQTQLLAGVRKSYEFQKLITGDGARGSVTDNTGNSSSSLSHVYTLVRSSRQQRRVFLTALLRHFEDYEKNALGLLLYLADTLAFLPYNTVEEPLFVVHHIDMTISITGSNLLQQFKESLGAGSMEEDEDVCSLSQQSCNVKYMSDCCFASQGCYLLLLLKQHLKKSFGLSDSKCQKYSPTESNKANDKTASRKGGVVFDPEQVVVLVRQEAISASKPILPKEECIRQYLEFKQLMNKLDPFDADDNGSDQDVPTGTSSSNATLQPQKVEDLSRVAALDRSLRATSIASSMGSRREKKERGTKSKRKKKIVISSDSSDNDGDPAWP